MKRKSCGWRYLLLAVSAWLLCPLSGYAQTMPPPEAKAVVGYSRVFLDEPGHFTVGGSLRFYLTGRFGLEPELVFMRGSDFEEWAFVPNLIYHLSDPRSRVSPYLIGGVGFLRCRQKSINFSTNEWTVSGGLGVRLSLTKRLFISPEARLGAHAFPRVTLGIGVSLSGN